MTSESGQAAGGIAPAGDGQSMTPAGSDIGVEIRTAQADEAEPVATVAAEAVASSPPADDIPDYIKNSRFGPPRRIVIQVPASAPLPEPMPEPAAMMEAPVTAAPMMMSAPEMYAPAMPPAYPQPMMVPQAYEQPAPAARPARRMPNAALRQRALRQAAMAAPVPVVAHPINAAPQVAYDDPQAAYAEAYEAPYGAGVPVEQSGGGAVATYRSRSAPSAEQETPERSSRGLVAILVIAVTIMLTGLSLLHLPKRSADASAPVEFHDFLVEVLCGSRDAPFTLDVSAPDKSAAAYAVASELDGCEVRKVTGASVAATAPAS